MDHAKNCGDGKGHLEWPGHRCQIFVLLQNLVLPFPPGRPVGVLLGTKSAAFRRLSS